MLFRYFLNLFCNKELTIFGDSFDLIILPVDDMPRVIIVKDNLYS